MSLLQATDTADSRPELRAKEDPAEMDSRKLAELLLPAVRGPHWPLTEKHFARLRQAAPRWWENAPFAVGVLVF